MKHTFSKPFKIKSQKINYIVIHSQYMIPLVMVLKQENVNTVTMKNDGIDTSFINSPEGEDKDHGNSLFEDLSSIERNENLDTTTYVPT